MKTVDWVALPLAIPSNTRLGGVPGTYMLSVRTPENARPEADPHRVDPGMPDQALFTPLVEGVGHGTF